MRTTTRTNQSGFTLIELLLYVAVSASILLAALTFHGSLLEARIKHQSVSEVETQGARMMEVLTQAIRNADAVTAPTAGQTASTLTLTSNVPADSPTVFALVNGALVSTLGAGSTTAHTNARVTASNLSFANVSRPTTPGVMRIRFTLASVNTSGRGEFTYTQTFIATAALR